MPIKYLNQDGKEKTREVNNLDGLISNPQKCSEEQKEYPKEVNQNDKIGEYLEEHCYCRFMEDLNPQNWYRQILEQLIVYKNVTKS